MANLRVRIVINKGREGAPLDKLGQIASEAERFLRLLAEDVGLTIPKGEWLAENFANGSVYFDAVHAAEYEWSQISTFNRGLDYVAAFDPDRQRVDGVASAKTIRQFARIADPLSIDDKVSFGLYEPEGTKVARWKPLSKPLAMKIAKKLDEVIEYHGSVQGAIHALFKTEMYFKLRHGLTGELVNCHFRQDLYDQVINALSRQDALVYVGGMIRARRADQSIEAVSVTHIRTAPTLSDEQYRAFFGCAPGLTGPISTEDYIEEARTHDA